MGARRVGYITRGREFAYWDDEMPNPFVEWRFKGSTEVQEEDFTGTLPTYQPGDLNASKCRRCTQHLLLRQSR